MNAEVQIPESERKFTAHKLPKKTTWAEGFEEAGVKDIYKPEPGSEHGVNTEDVMRRKTREAKNN